ncbi:hypothetical protein ACFL5O_07440 [Myxococcota bacterium]
MLPSCRLLVLIGIAGAALGCADAFGNEVRGSVVFTTWGEEYIEQEIPAAPPAEEGLADGWTVRYSKFLLVIRNLVVANEQGKEAARMAGSGLFDLRAGGEQSVATFSELPAQAWTQVSYQIGPAGQDTTVGGAATEEDLATFRSEGLSVHVIGTASKAPLEKRFDWKFSGTTLYRNCKAELDGKETHGVIVTNGGTDTVQLTMHGDHFFYDDLEASTAKRRFTAIACADADEDGEVTLDELARASLLPDLNSQQADCRGRPVYRPGSQSVNDLRAFVTALSRTVGHFRGEGECVSIKLE